MRVIEQILDLARWAPSGDNTQPWRFEILADDHVLIHGFDTRHWCVYDLEGHASQIAVGALLETVRIASTGHGLRAEWTRRPNTPDTHLLFDVVLNPDRLLTPDPLISCIKTRTVQRRAMGSRSLTTEERGQLEAAAHPFKMRWFESFGDRLTVARLNFFSAEIRLTIPEAYETHVRVIEWGARFSEDRIPEAAVGIDPLTARLMKFVMKSWRRVEFFNKWLAGTFTPRIQLDLVPGIACSAHAALIAPLISSTIDDRIEAGQAIQRLWLTCEKLGLQHQPEMTPLIFGHFARTGQKFSGVSPALDRACRVAERFDLLLGRGDARRAVWMCRIGRACATKGRSIRRRELTLTADAENIR